MSHSNISIFIPHNGCNHRCSFCNQIYITGQQKMPDEIDIENAVNVAIKSKNYDKNNTQLAFFGGSFTAIDRDLMLKYLETGYKFVKDNYIESIRISTRPDAIDKEILDILKEYKVKSIELGAQSMADEVLLANNRGHGAKDVENASMLIRENGFELGLQMMTGLYKSDFEKDYYTAKKIASLKPDTVRIYPTVVLKNTQLEKLYKSGEYEPISVEKACSDGAKILKLFYDKGIRVIRFGLHSIDEKSFVAGAFHPALSEMAQSYIYRDLIENEIKKKGFYKVLVNINEISKAIGNKKSNIDYFKNKGVILEIIGDENISRFQIKIEK